MISTVPQGVWWEPYSEAAAAIATVIIAVLVYLLNRRQHRDTVKFEERQFELEKQAFRLQLLESRSELIIKLRHAYRLWLASDPPDLDDLATVVHEISAKIDLLYNMRVRFAVAKAFGLLELACRDWNQLIANYIEDGVPDAEAYQRLRLDITKGLADLMGEVEQASRIDEKYL